MHDLGRSPATSVEGFSDTARAKLPLPKFINRDSQRSDRSITAIDLAFLPANALPGHSIARRTKSLFAAYVERM